MKKIIVVACFVCSAFAVAVGSHAAEVILGPDLKIPRYYMPGSGGCFPGRGYGFSAEAANYPST